MILKKLMGLFAVTGFVLLLSLLLVPHADDAAKQTSASPVSWSGPMPVGSAQQRSPAAPSDRTRPTPHQDDVIFETIPPDLGYTPGLRARRVLPKGDVARVAQLPERATGILVVKFSDDVQARFHPQRGAVSRTGRDLRTFEDLVRNLGLTVDRAFYRTEVQLRAVEKRAELHSGTAQPDLAGMLHLTGPPARLVQAAQWLHAQDFVEWVEFEVNPSLADDPQGCGEPDEGERPPGDCHAVDVPAPYCLDDDCCAEVCSIDPFCCDDTIFWPGRACPGFAGPNGYWDINCVLLAQQLGQIDCPGGAPPPEPPQCFLPFNNPCVVPGVGPGCSPSGCCQLVCDEIPSCCTAQWGSVCVAKAAEICTVLDPDAGTPSFEQLQGYLTAAPYTPEQLAAYVDLGTITTYTDCNGNILPLPGWNGEGYNLAGLDALGEFLLGEYGIGSAPDAPGESLVRGKTIRVGIVEHTAHVHPSDPTRMHENLRHVISEEGQTPLIVPFAELPELHGNHGTATLGIVGARGEIDLDGTPGGMLGVAPDVELWFFPIVSVEEGGRLGRALLSAIEAFDPGDVLSLSIGLGNGGTIANTQRNWTLFRLATDSGITSVISAGNSCLNLDNPPVAAQFDCADSGVIVVGAGYPGCGPGNCHCRLPFSNYCEECPEETGLFGGESCRVHVQAWGTAVATTGYGDIFVGTNNGDFYDGFDNPFGGTPFRAYTLFFGGTSAAAPQVAGIVARMQGLAKQFFGVPLHPVQIRDVVSENGIYQCGIPPELGGPPGGGNACLGDHDLDAESRHIGIYTMPQLAGESLLAGGWFDCIGPECANCEELWDDVFAVRGTHLFGNTWSVCVVDGNSFTVRSQGTTASSKPSFKPPGLEGPLNDVVYRSTGQIADVLAVGRVEDPSLVVQFGVLAVTAPTGIPTIQHIELYDWIANRWQWGATAFVPGGGNVMFTPEFATFNPQRFFDTDGRFLVRVWAYGWNAPPQAGGNFGSGTANAFDFRVDMIDVDITNLGDTPGGGG